MGRRVVIVAGAGCTRSDAQKTSEVRQPPLDQGFFRNAEIFFKKWETKGKATPLLLVKSHMEGEYGICITEPYWDSLEKVMTTIFTDVALPRRGSGAPYAFHHLLLAIAWRLAETTNRLRITRSSNLHRLISHFLDTGVSPENLCVLTFNYDLHGERSLDRIQREKGRRRIRIFNFPWCYQLKDKAQPYKESTSANAFPIGEAPEGGIAVLKLHGSLNWVSFHEDISTRIMDRHCPLFVVAARRIKNMVVVDPRGPYGLPILTPPVPAKSRIWHDVFNELWMEAESRLSNADEVVVFGYSCPPADMESEQMFRRALRLKEFSPRLCVIDPNPEVAVRFARLIRHGHLNYYKSAESFFDEIKTYEDRRETAELWSADVNEPVSLPKKWVDFVLYG